MPAGLVIVANTVRSLLQSTQLFLFLPLPGDAMRFFTKEYCTNE